MKGNGENPRVLIKNLLSTLTGVSVKIKNYCLFDQIFFLEFFNGNGMIVKKAKAGAGGDAGVMQATE